jgi:hypothetical protein
MEPRRYKLGLGDEAYGPGDIGKIAVIDDGLIEGPDCANWQRQGLLVMCLDPKTYHDEELRYLVLSPRYAKDSLTSIRTSGGIVAVARFLPGTCIDKPKHFEPDQITYWAVGVLSPPLAP